MTDADNAQAWANVAAARALVGILASGGRHVVLSPGARNAPLVLAVHEHPEAIAHVVLDERAAAFVALGLAKATGRAAVLVCTSGSAGGHYLPAVMEAFHAQVPLVVITADRPDELQHVGAPQATDQTALFGNHVAAARRLPTPRATPGAPCQGDGAQVARPITAAWRLQTAQLLAVAEGPAMGPVHLNAPFAEPLVPGPLDMPPMRPGSTGAARPVAAPVQPGEEGYGALMAFARAHSPGVIVCGPLPSEPSETRRHTAVLALAKALGWPILADPLSGLRFGVPRGAGATVLHRYDLALERGCDVPAVSGVLCIGAQPTSKRLQQWLQGAAGRTVVLSAPGCVQPMHLHGGLQVAGDVAQVCGAWAERLTAALVAPCGAEHAAVFAAWDEGAAPGGSDDAAGASDAHAPLRPSTLWPALLAALPAGSGLHVGSSMPVRDLDRYGGPTCQPLRISASRGLNGIDGFIATAAGLALGDPRRWTGVLGDLTFLHDIGALQAARQLRVTATLVVINNRGGEIFTKLPIAQHSELFERYFRTPQEADIGPLCRACACSHEVVYTGAALGQAVLEASTRAADGRLHVIEAVMAQAALAAPTS